MSLQIYQPNDSIGKLIQGLYHSSTNEWLSKSQCDLVVESLYRLKIYDPMWLHDINLLELRLSYFFSPSFCCKKNVVVFPTHQLFVREITENLCINSSIHNPVVFVTKPVAHFLLREYPIKINIDFQQLQADNKKIKFLSVGSLVISSNVDVILSKSSIINIDRAFKLASSEIKPGVFKIDDDQKDIQLNDIVVNKFNKKQGKITDVDFGEQGFVSISHDDGSSINLSKIDFDKQYILAGGL